MAATAAQIARLRLLTDEPTTTPYSDATLTGIIERYPLTDILGTEPHKVDYTTVPPTVSVRDSWIATYDMNLAAAEVWDMKAAAVAEDYATDSDGAVLHRNQVFEQYSTAAKRFRSRRSPSALKMSAAPKMALSADLGTVGNID